MTTEIAYVQEAALDGKQIHGGCTAPIDLCLYWMARRLIDCQSDMNHKPVANTEIAAGILPAFDELVKGERSIAINGKQKYIVDKRFLKEEESVDKPGKGVDCNRCQLQVFNYFWMYKKEEGLSNCKDYCSKCIDAAAAKIPKNKGQFKLKYVHCTYTALEDLVTYLRRFIA